MYTKNQLIIVSLIVAAVSALLTSLVMKHKAIGDMTEEKTSGLVKPLLDKTKCDENTSTERGVKVVSEQNPGGACKVKNN